MAAQPPCRAPVTGVAVPRSRSALVERSDRSAAARVALVKLGSAMTEPCSPGSAVAL